MKILASNVSIVLDLLRGDGSACYYDRKIILVIGELDVSRLSRQMKGTEKMYGR